MPSSWYKPSSGRLSQRQLAWMHALLMLLELRREHGVELLREVTGLIERCELRSCADCHVFTIHVDGVCQKCGRSPAKSNSFSWEM